MARIIRVSQQGLSRCPSCQTHIKIEAKLEETVCPFCQTALLAQPAEAAPSQRVLKGRGAKMALGLFGTAVIIGACIAPPAALYGIPPQENTQQEQTQGDGGAQDTVVETAPDAGPVPKYGIPPSP